MNRTDLLRKMRKSRLFMVGSIGFALILLLCLFGPYLLPWNAEQADLTSRFVEPEGFSKGLEGHILGTDALGRDMLTRLLKGGQSSFLISFSVVLISCGMGLLMGLISGYMGGWVDTVIMRLCDIILAVPGLMIAIVVVSILGTKFINLIIVLGAFSWPMVARIIRSKVLSVRNGDFVNASRVLGSNNRRIIWWDILPNVLMPLLINVSERIGSTILVETSMSYLGVGVPLPRPSWGGMIADGRDYIATHPYIVVIPGIALMLTVLSVNFLGDGLRDVLDPKNKD